MKEKISNNNWELIIDLDGGRIEELKFKGKLILGTFKRKDGKMANTHLCLPNFGDEGMKKFNLEFHGPFRKTKWNLFNKNKDSIEIEVVNLGLKVRQIFGIDNNFEQKILIENLTDSDRIINVAIHNYWDSIEGWRTSILNGKKIDNLIMSDSDCQVRKNNLIEIDKKKLIRWELEGFNYAQFWTGFIEKEGVKIFDKEYFCIEPCLEKQGFLDIGENNLKVGGKMELGQKIGVVYRT